MQDGQEKMLFEVVDALLESQGTCCELLRDLVDDFQDTDCHCGCATCRDCRRRETILKLRVVLSSSTPLLSRAANVFSRENPRDMVRREDSLGAISVNSEREFSLPASSADVSTNNLRSAIPSPFASRSRVELSPQRIERSIKQDVGGAEFSSASFGRLSNEARRIIPAADEVLTWARSNFSSAVPFVAK